MSARLGCRLSGPIGAWPSHCQTLKFFGAKGNAHRKNKKVLKQRQEARKSKNSEGMKTALALCIPMHGRFGFPDRRCKQHLSTQLRTWAGTRRAETSLRGQWPRTSTPCFSNSGSRTAPLRGHRGALKGLERKGLPPSSFSTKRKQKRGLAEASQRPLLPFSP